MAWNDSVHEDVRYLSGSPVRIAVLRAIRQQPRRPAALTDCVDVTRTTVQRVLAGFLDRQWVCKDGSTYRISPTGRRVCAAYETVLDEAAAARKVVPVVAEAPTVIEELPLSALADCEITVATEQDPLAVVDRVVDRFAAGSGSHVVAASPIVTQSFNRVAADLLADGTTIEHVIDERVLDASATEFPEALDRAIEHDAISVYVADEPVPFGFFTYDDVVCAAGYDDRNRPSVLLESTDSDVVAWARDRFERMREAATPLETYVS